MAGPTPPGAANRPDSSTAATTLNAGNWWMRIMLRIVSSLDGFVNSRSDLGENCACRVSRRIHRLEVTGISRAGVVLALETRTGPIESTGPWHGGVWPGVEKV